MTICFFNSKDRRVSLFTKSLKVLKTINNVTSFVLMTNMLYLGLEGEQ